MERPWSRLCDGSSGSRSRDSGSVGSLNGGNSRGSSHIHSWSGGSGSSLNGRGRSSGALVGRAVARDVASLGALVANLAGGAERAAVGRGAVTRDVAELAAGVALHGLSLAVAGEVVGATALVAGGGTGVATESAAESTLETASATTGTAASGGTSGSASSGSSRVCAVALESGYYHFDSIPGFEAGTYGKVAGLAAVVATAIRAAVQTQGGAVSLDVAKTLAVVALLGCVIISIQK